MTWSTGTPRQQGQYLAVDVVYRFRQAATWRPDLGWNIRGRWLGHDAVECWQELPDLPPRPRRDD